MERTANVTYLIDANNYICRQLGISTPLCRDIEQFTSEVDGWLLKCEHETGRVPEVQLVLDPGASACDLDGLVGRFLVRVAPHGVTADDHIAGIARTLNLSQPDRHIRIVTDDRQDEFARLLNEQFTLFPNSWLRRKLSAVKPEDDYEAYENGRMEAAQLERQRPALKTDEPRDDPTASHLRRLQSDAWRTRKKAARALRHFESDEAYRALERCARSDEHPKVRKTAVESLVKVGISLAFSNRKFRPELRDSLSWVSEHETDDDVRATASHWCDWLNSN